MTENDTAKPDGPDVAVSLDSRISRNEAIVFTDLDDTIVMMDVDEGQYYELDPVGARIWALLETGRAAADLCDALTAEFDVDPDTCRRDTLEFLQTAGSLRIVQVQPAPAPGDDADDVG